MQFHETYCFPLEMHNCKIHLRARHPWSEHIQSLSLVELFVGRCDSIVQFCAFGSPCLKELLMRHSLMKDSRFIRKYRWCVCETPTYRCVMVSSSCVFSPPLHHSPPQRRFNPSSHGIFKI